MVCTIIVACLGGIYFFWYFNVYNQLVSFRNAIEQSWSNVEVELNRRFDLIGNLVSVVKGYAKYEQDTLNQIVAARSTASEHHSVDDAIRLQDELQKSVTKLFMLAESYPDLKADEQFLKLQTELTETENRIAERRMAYNNTVNLYLNCKQEFPSSVIASAHKFPEKLYFDLPDEKAAQAVKVELK